MSPLVVGTGQVAEVPVDQLTADLGLGNVDKVLVRVSG
jgi:hypothetical protein